MNMSKIWLTGYICGAVVTAISILQNEDWSIAEKIMTSVLWPIAFSIASWQHVLS